MRTRARNKYGAVKTKVDGYAFDSKREAARYQELQLLAKAGEIHSLRVHPRYRLCPFTPQARLAMVVASIGHYEADFAYCLPGRHDAALTCGFGCAVEDVKGVDTPLSKWKRRHVEAQYGITIQVIR